jgi:hypothetical protein
MTTSHSTEIRPFRLEIPDVQIADLHDRLSHTRWADRPLHTGWTRGVPPRTCGSLSTTGEMDTTGASESQP